MLPISKYALYDACFSYVQQRTDQAKAGIAAAQESSNTETKSSAGDKYETGRAMAQQERDRCAAQLYEAKQLSNALQKIKPKFSCITVRLGALVQTSIGLFYISIGAGKLYTNEGLEFMAISPVAPIALALNGRHIGEEITFNGRLVRILDIN